MDVKPEVVSSIAGARLLAVSPVVMVDPRRRKFHRPVTVSVPLSRLPAAYPASAAASDLRLLCSLAGASSEVDLKCDESKQVSVFYIAQKINSHNSLRFSSLK